MLRFSLPMVFVVVSAHAHWNQPPEPITEPIICKGHPGTFAVVQAGNELSTIVVYENNQVLKTITKAYHVHSLQFSAGCVRLMISSENGRESIPLYDENHSHP